jgi:tRNA threonylcarbamoyladenosine modification (KEOPS) complex Cgi121 subunit
MKYYGKLSMYKIIGAKGSIKDINKFINMISSFSKKHEIILQVFDADLIYGKNHLLSSIYHALRAIERKKNSTNSLAMEIMLYASGERQLKLAIPKMGIKNNTKNIALLLINRRNINIQISDNLINDLLEFISFKRCDSVLVGNEKTLIKFGINKNEIKTISKKNHQNLVIEKVALVDINK